MLDFAVRRFFSIRFLFRSFLLSTLTHFLLPAFPPNPRPAAKQQQTDIGANLCDPMFQGSYGGKSYHEPDLGAVLQRARGAGVAKIIVTAGSLAESEEALEMSRSSSSGSSSSSSSSPVELFCSAGVHPTRAGELLLKSEGTEEEGNGGGGKKTLDAAAVGRLGALLQRGFRGEEESEDDGGGHGKQQQQQPPRLVALGETGLDYARLQFADAEAQRLAFDAQLDLAAAAPLGGALPLFLHLRDAGDDFVALLSKPRFCGKADPSTSSSSSPAKPVVLRGVVHSFDGGVDLMRRLLSLENRDLFIGFNGCSLRDGSGLEAAREVPLDRLLLETDAPWCDLRPTHASSAAQEGFDLKDFDAKNGVVWKDKRKIGAEDDKTSYLVKGRNEPCRIAAVAEAIAVARGCSVAEVSRAAWETSERLFFGGGGGGGG